VRNVANQNQSYPLQQLPSRRMALSLAIGDRIQHQYEAMQSLQQQIFSVRSSSATTSCEEYSNQTKASSAEGKMPMLQKVGKVCCVIFVISR
jgi:hypothetical protein